MVADVERLVVEHLGLASWCAGKWSRRTGLERDELHGIALLALVEAGGRFDPGRGVKFATFAEFAVEGAILDWIRKLRGRNPDGLRRLGVVSLDDRLAERNEQGRVGDRADEVASRVGSAQLATLALSAKLTPRERQVIWLRYYDGHSSSEAAEILGISDSRAWQLEQVALQRMRRRVAAAA